MLKRLKDLWMQFARLLATINTAVLLTVLFVCVITPLGLLMRILRRSPLRSTPPADSQWIALPSGDDPRKPF